MNIEAEVKLFLKELKEHIKIWDLIFINRPKNGVQHLADLGITANTRKEIIAQLDIEDYSQGPLPETQYNGKEMWIFGKVIRKKEIYIKLTIGRETNNAICISFHKAEDNMVFPLKD